MKTEGAASGMREEVRGFVIHRGVLGCEAQRAMLEDLRPGLQAAPFVRPVTPGGRPMSVRMSAAGRLGWVTDRQGYRYAPRHPLGMDWPPIPDSVLAVWRALTGLERLPDCCLINHYAPDARMGLHQDRDEGDFTFPVVSISLGAAALFRMGGTARADGTESRWLNSGDVVVMGGAARLAWHGVDRIRGGSSTLLADGGRMNLTLRVVARA
jgi:alkylated DNA repair protein (DNA oxidative demethylase)